MYVYIKKFFLEYVANIRNNLEIAFMSDAQLIIIAIVCRNRTFSCNYLPNQLYRSLEPVTAQKLKY